MRILHTTNEIPVVGQFIIEIRVKEDGQLDPIDAYNWERSDGFSNWTTHWIDFDEAINKLKEIEEEDETRQTGCAE